MITCDAAEVHACRCSVQMANASLPIAKKYPVFLSADDIKGLEGLSVYMKEESGYAEIQKTKPDTIGYALNDSPAGDQLCLAQAWLCAETMLDAPLSMPWRALGSGMGELHVQASRAS